MLSNECAAHYLQTLLYTPRLNRRFWWCDSAPVSRGILEQRNYQQSLASRWFPLFDCTAGSRGCRRRKLHWRFRKCTAHNKQAFKVVIVRLTRVCSAYTSVCLSDSLCLFYRSWMMLEPTWRTWMLMKWVVVGCWETAAPTEHRFICLLYPFKSLYVCYYGRMICTAGRDCSILERLVTFYWKLEARYARIMTQCTSAWI